MAFVYNLSGALGSGVQTNIAPSGLTYRRPYSNQEWVGSASTITSVCSGVEYGREIDFRIDPTDGNQLDVDAYTFVIFNNNTWREKMSLEREKHHPPAYIAQNNSTIFYIGELAGITPCGAAIIILSEKPKSEN